MPKVKAEITIAESLVRKLGKEALLDIIRREKENIHTTMIENAGKMWDAYHAKPTKKKKLPTVIDENTVVNESVGGHDREVE